MENNERGWWHKPQRIIQTNLQVKDTHLIEPRRLARQMKELGATALVFNVGGIYAWYPSEVEGHHVNEYLPQDFDLLKGVVDACHDEGIRFIARLDFSKTDDIVYLKRPGWFVRKQDGQPEIIGAHRPGAWSLLMSTCLNAGYRNEDVAVPVLDEVLSRYDVDAVFFNAPHFLPCWCGICQRKYERLYGVTLPPDPAAFAADWPSACIRDNMDKMYRFIKGKRPEVQMILYYNLYKDNLYDRLETTDLLCTEPQDVLSEGHRRIPEFWKPALSIKLGRSAHGVPAPLGIVHSSPGMEWRHIGLPPAEYRFWLSQIPAHGGSIWHSLTGIPETIGDKRILETVAALNRDVAKVEPYMDGAGTLAQVALLWTANAAAEGWADGLINRQVPFDVLLEEQATPERLARYKALIAPEGLALTEGMAATLAGYAAAGGHVIAEGDAADKPEWRDLLGVRDQGAAGELLSAAYLRFEGADNPLQAGLADTELIALRGAVYYAQPTAETAVLATLVPPFAPLECVGAPPERASLPVIRTDLPLALHRRSGLGGFLYFPFSLSGMLNEFKLGEHYQLLANAIDLALGEDKLVEITNYQGLQVTLFERDDYVLVHLVNGAGRRPLATNLPLHDISLKLRLPGRRVADVRRLIAEDALPYSEVDGVAVIDVPKLEVWECLLVRTESDSTA
ncbi:hypothetical protein ACFSR7_17945 [Cohnella sp. GCM10020058]|uniref:hypothetical protein n=1 Tax=Cohnella sp. GCM10020058 TaxID=3317330 RepID=UPI003630FB7B